MKKIIYSMSNPYIKHLRNLATRRGREKCGEFLIEGLRFVEEALSSARVRSVIYADRILQHERGRRLIEVAKCLGINLVPVKDQLLALLADTETPQGVLAVVEQFHWTWDDVLGRTSIPFLLIIDQLRDPGNLGTIIRTAEAAGVSGVVVLKGTVDLYNAKVLRATMGSIFRLPVLTEVEPAQICWLREQGIKLVVSDLETEHLYDQADYTQPLAIVVGNEAHGCQSELCQIADQIVKIPLAGQVESLNVGVATGILLYEVARQRRLVGSSACQGCGGVI